MSKDIKVKFSRPKVKTVEGGEEERFVTTAQTVVIEATDEKGLARIATELLSEYDGTLEVTISVKESKDKDE